MLTLQRQLFLMHSFTGAAPVGTVLYCGAVLCCAVLYCAVHWHRAALFMALLQCFDRALEC